ncbi:sugar phosphate nucleotidyltransferase [Kitasatospora sp. NPDC089509]|uniref:sugar phosphate nucleotidyltransferase n=1 Tax=Kitasatospora sp. NPDC089509 TaxID=3364079 RepID=UPI0037F7B461
MSGPLRPQQAVVLAGGTGSRLGALTTGIPKVLIPVAGRPFLSLLLLQLQAHGVRRVHFCLGHLADQVLRHLELSAPPGLEWTASVEPRQLGTAGALVHAVPYLDEEFVVLMGDSLMPVDPAALLDGHRRLGLGASLAVLRNDDWLVPSNVRVEGVWVTGYSKEARQGMRHVDYGMAVLRRSHLVRQADAADGMADLGPLLRSLIADGQLAAVEVDRRFYEIGSPWGLAELEGLLSGPAPAFPSPEFEEYSHVRHWRPTRHEGDHRVPAGLPQSLDVTP